MGIETRLAESNEVQCRYTVGEYLKMARDQHQSIAKKLARIDQAKLVQKLKDLGDKPIEILGGGMQRIADSRYVSMIRFVAEFATAVAATDINASQGRDLASERPAFSQTFDSSGGSSLDGPNTLNNSENLPSGDAPPAATDNSNEEPEDPASEEEPEEEGDEEETDPVILKARDINKALCEKFGTSLKDEGEQDYFSGMPAALNRTIFFLYQDMINEKGGEMDEKLQDDEYKEKIKTACNMTSDEFGTIERLAADDAENGDSPNYALKCVLYTLSILKDPNISEKIEEFRKLTGADKSVYIELEPLNCHFFLTKWLTAVAEDPTKLVSALADTEVLKNITELGIGDILSEFSEKIRGIENDSGKKSNLIREVATAVVGSDKIRESIDKLINDGWCSIGEISEEYFPVASSTEEGHSEGDNVSLRDDPGYKSLNT